MLITWKCVAFSSDFEGVFCLHTQASLRSDSNLLVLLCIFGYFSNTALIYEWQQAGGERVSTLAITWVQGSLSTARHSYPRTCTNLLTDTSWSHSSGHGHFVSPVTALRAVMVMSGSDSGLLMLLLASGQVATCHAVPHNVLLGMLIISKLQLQYMTAVKATECGTHSELHFP